ncbi:SusC/RagA family TonB-linked outer membrane protein [Mucilaginibacter pedocola]|uniref:SusC/RagA family protein n=1 Tax=Mucilaginibacter pedocola TaxID=1792845 RepID=A0A1S9P716_9SPHI|nr:TonB-dependent receptor [Mucilaginibacter pedocola]OOQ56746.1 SusC/RagA family protein [Mucilaginibacter pedocola]
MRKLLLFCSLLVILASGAFAQTKELSGVVKDHEAKPLPGVTVVVAGTQTSTFTDVNGKFKIKASAGQTLTFSFVGYKTIDLKVGDTGAPLDVQFQPGSNELNEVVVTGYQKERKKDLTGAVSVVNTKDIKDVPLGNPIKALQGRIAGVNITTDGNPGGGATVRIRGIGTLGNNDPLYVIDGVPTTRGLQELNQNDIESIQVLKDASSASIYGSRAANGVIIVTTKKAKSGQSRINFNASSSLQFNTSKLDVLNTDERGRAYWQAAVNDKQNPNLNSTYQYDWNNDFNNPVLNRVILPEFLDAAKTMKPANTRWFDEISQTSLIQQYSLDVSNGNERSNSLFSVSYYDNKGIIKQTRNQKTTLRFNSDYSLFNGRLKIGENFSASYIRSPSLPLGDITILSLIDFSIIPVHTIDGGWGGPSAGMADRQNPVRLIEDNKQNINHLGRIFGNAYADLSILPNLTLSTNYGIDYANNFSRSLRKSYVSGYLVDPSNAVSANTSYDGNLIWKNQLTYSLNLNKHKISVLAAHEQIKVMNRSLSGSRQGYALENINYAYLNAGSTNIANGGGGSGNALLSVFGRVNYSYNDRYIASVTLRRDGSSRFGSNNRYGTFPAASIGWRASEESFVKENLPFISDLKLRYGWGKTGNQEIGNYASYSLYSPIYGTNPTGAFDGGTAYDIGGTGTGQLQSGYVLIQTGNPDIRWEEKTENNYGIDFGLFDNKISGSVDYFTKNTTGILISPAYLAVKGDGGTRFANGAAVANKGLEVVLNYSTVINNDWKFELSGNFSTYKNKITSLPSEVLTSYPGNGTDKTILGRSVNSMFGYVADGIFQNQTEVDAAAAQPGKGVGRIRYKDLNGDNVINDKDRDYIGSGDPDFLYGFNANITYKNFDFSFFLQGVQGNDVNNTYKGLTDFSSLQPGANWGSRVLTAWTPQNTSSTIPALTTVDRNNEGRFSTYFIEKGSYLKLRNVQLGYNLKGLLSKYKVQNARIYFQASNLLNIKSKSYTAPDPENPGNGFPIPVITSIGLNVSF